MKTTVRQLISNELLSGNVNIPILTIRKVSSLFVNKDLIHFIQGLLAETTDLNQQEKMLIRLKKVIIQTERNLDQGEIEAREEEAFHFFNEIKKEQAFYNPIKWIDAELDCLRNLRIAANVDPVENKEQLDRKEMLQVYKISKSNLNRRIADGMPFYKIGAKLLFNRTQVNNWLQSLAN